jgi:hypothetical protein
MLPVASMSQLSRFRRCSNRSDRCRSPVGKLFQTDFMSENRDLLEPEAATDSIQKRNPPIMRVLAGIVAAVMLVGAVNSLVEFSGWADIRDAFIFMLLSYLFGGYALGYFNPRWGRKE